MTQIRAGRRHRRSEDCADLRRYIDLGSGGTTACGLNFVISTSPGQIAPAPRGEH